jgi:hypothetical protein
MEGRAGKEAVACSSQMLSQQLTAEERKFCQGTDNQKVENLTRTLQKKIMDANH